MFILVSSLDANVRTRALIGNRRNSNWDKMNSGFIFVSLENIAVFFFFNNYFTF